MRAARSPHAAACIPARDSARRPVRSLARALAWLLVPALAALSLAGCGFGGLNSLPLPGAVGRGPGSTTYHVELANVSTLESNSPVLVGDVVVGSVGEMKVRDWIADVQISVKPGVSIPANVVAKVGQTSLLGSMHLALDPPAGEPPRGRLAPGATLGLNRSSTYPSTEQTLSALSVVINGGGLGQIGDIVNELNAAFNGREPQIRDLLTRLNEFVGVLAEQRDSINATIDSLNRLSGTLAGQREVLTEALERIPPALDVLIAERPTLTAALQKLGGLSNLAAGVVDDTRDELITNLRNLEPTLRSLADVGPKLNKSLAYFFSAFPYGQATIDRAIRGDYLNQFIIFDFTVPRLKKTLMLGTRWGQEGAKLVPAPGDPWYATYTYDPIRAPLEAPPSEVAGVGPLVDPPDSPDLPGSPDLPDPQIVPKSGAGGDFPVPHLPGSAPGPGGN